ncbi:MAG: hypothetical protein K0U78_09975 [Actinomycetia bacterium]|nr:hypothetical protein [Actinomycetes bacterium]
MTWTIDIEQEKGKQEGDIDYTWVNVPLNADIDGEWSFTATKTVVSEKGIFMMNDDEEQALGLHLKSKYGDDKSNGMRFIRAFAVANNSNEVNKEVIEAVGEGLTLTVDLVATKNGNDYKRFTVALGGDE